MPSISASINDFYAMSDSADTCPTCSNFLSVNQKAPKWRLIFIADAFPLHLSLNQKCKNKKPKQKRQKQYQTMREKTRKQRLGISTPPSKTLNTENTKRKTENRAKEKRQSEKPVHQGVTPLRNKKNTFFLANSWSLLGKKCVIIFIKNCQLRGDAM